MDVEESLRRACCIAATVALAWAPNALAETRFENRLDLEWVYDIESEEHQKGELLWHPRIDSEFSEACRFVIEGRLRADASDVLEPDVPDHPTYSDLSEREFFGTQMDAELRELWLRCASGPFFLTLGKQQVVWGKADGLKILDVVDPQSFREFILDEFEDSRIPLWTVNLEIAFGASNLQLIFVPDTTVHELPVPGSPFAFTSPLLLPPVSATGGSTQIAPIDRPDDEIEDADWGARFSTFLGGWDLSFVYLDHLDDQPVFAQRQGTDPIAGPTLFVQPTYRRYDLFGATFSNAFGDLTIRGEVGYAQDRAFTALPIDVLPSGAPLDTDGLAVTDELSYVLGLDWYGLSQSLLSFQVFESRLQDDDLPLLRPQNTTFYTGLYRWWTGGERLQLELFWLHGEEADDGLVRPELRWSWNDVGTFYLGYDAFYGDAVGYFGQFRERDRTRLGFRFDF